MNEANQIAAALAGIAGVASVTRGWPRQAAKLPCIAVGLTEQSIADTRDNAVYLLQRTYGIRVFAQTMTACDALQAPIIAAMQGLGYQLERTQEAEGEIAQQKLTFQKLS